MSDFTFTLDLKVFDPQQVYAAACERMRQDDLDDGARISSQEEVEELLGTPDEPNITECLVMLLDPGSLPGCTIYQSKTETEGSLRVRFGGEGDDD